MQTDKATVVRLMRARKLRLVHLVSKDGSWLLIDGSGYSPTQEIPDCSVDPALAEMLVRDGIIKDFLSTSGHVHPAHQNIVYHYNDDFGGGDSTLDAQE